VGFVWLVKALLGAFNKLCFTPSRALNFNVGLVIFSSLENFMLKFTRFASLASAAVVIVGLTACAAPMYPNQNQNYPSPNQSSQGQYPASQYPAAQYPSTNAPPNYAEYGRINNIEVMRSQGSGSTSGAGAIIGGLAGAVIGNQIGSGSGRTAAQIAGVAGGAFAGNAIERNNNSQVAESFRITVQLDRGGLRSFDTPAVGDLRMGDRVRVENGQIFRN
jgi:outer membrane lipoprotein SlyB